MISKLFGLKVDYTMYQQAGNSMTEFKLDPRLANDCFLIAENNLNLVLLMNNADIPWFILVPKTDVIEWLDLADEHERLLKSDIDCVAQWVREHHPIDKLNIAAIGNVVSQLHIHVIGRYKTDYCWPDVIWGKPAPSAYESETVEQIREQLLTYAGNRFRSITAE